MKLIGRIGPVMMVLGALGALGPLAPPTALGRPTPAALSHRVNLTAEIETLSATGTIGAPGTKDTDAGIVDGTVSGSPRWSGALRQVVTWGPDLTISSKGTAFDAAGTLRFKLTGKFTPRTAGGLALTGALAVTGGSGSYNRASGTLRFTGVASVGAGTKATLHLTGSLRYPG